MNAPVSNVFPENIKTVSPAPNSVADPDPYTDLNITIEDVQQPGGTVAGNNTPPRTGSTSLGNTRQFYAADANTELNAPT